MKILLVEDDRDLAVVITKFLERNGYEVVAAPDALAGLDAVQAHFFDLVITDLALPHMDGVAFVSRLRAGGPTARVPIIMITAYGTDAVVDESLRKGVAFILPKPIDFDRLLATVRFAE